MWPSVHFYLLQIDGTFDLYESNFVGTHNTCRTLALEEVVVVIVVTTTAATITYYYLLTSEKSDEFVCREREIKLGSIYSQY